MKVYRYTYDGTGIYEALKQKAFKDGNWRNLKEDKRINWLPVPPIYEQERNHKSYFTPKGMSKFETTTMPLIWKYLDSSKIRREEYDLDTRPKYQDQYQVVI